MPTVRELTTLDPYQMKDFLIELAETYFQTDKLDTYESGFLGYLIQALSHLTSDTLFLNAMSYNEAFTTRAVLDNSLINLASMFDYDYDKVLPATGSLKLRIPLNNTGFSFTIPQFSRASADGIPYRVYKTYNVYVDSLAAIRVYSVDSNNVLNSVPITITTENNIPVLNFYVDVKQVDYYKYNFTFPRTYLYKFYHEYIKSVDDYVSNIRVFVNGEEYTNVNSIFEANADDKVFQFTYMNKTVDITFGNGVFGHLPDDGDECSLIIETTKGIDGNIIADTLQLTERIYDNSGKAIIIYSSNDQPITNGSNPESISELRGNIISHISSLDRLVNEKDYKSFEKIIPYFKNTIGENYLLRRDIHMNEIDNFLVFFDENNDPIYTTSYSFESATTSFAKDTEFSVDGYDFICPYRFYLDLTENIKHVHFEYIVSNLDDSPYLEQSYRDEIIGLDRVNFVYTGNDKIKVNVYAEVDNSVDPLDLSAQLTINSLVIPIPINGSDTSGTSSVMTSAEVDVGLIDSGENMYTLELYYQSNLHTKYKSKIILRQNLDDVVWSDFVESTISPGTYKIYNVPLIAKSYYEEHSDYIDLNMLQNIAKFKEYYYDYNMMTDVVNVKFAKTYGKSINMRLNSYNDDAKYTYSVAYSLDIPFQLKIKAVLYNNHSRTIQDIRKEIRDVAYTYFHSNADFNMDILRSNVVRYIHDVVDDVAYCEVITPSEEIVYSFDLDDIPTTERDTLLSFVPEYIWLKKDDIYVEIEVLSM